MVRTHPALPLSLIHILLCIRDVEEYVCALFDVPGCVPVSYTHLDVYKRQERGLAVQFVTQINGHDVVSYRRCAASLPLIN